MKAKVYVDGQEGTTGLMIHERLKDRQELEILKIDPEKRKNIEARRRLINEADIVFLCLPDGASREAVSLVDNEKTRVIDASTAFRTHPEWAYGIPELSPVHREKISRAKRVAVPGCHASGFVIALYPLVQEGIVGKDYPITSFSITGYSGGGKKLIERYEDVNQDHAGLKSPNLYGLGLTHKHLPEMQAVIGLTYPPVFTPIISNFYKGMLVSVPFAKRLLNRPLTAQQVHQFLEAYYHGQHFVQVMPFEADANLDQGFLDSIQCNDTNMNQLFVFGNDEQILLVSRLDNLGKGSSGAAVQNMNIMLGLDERAGLI